MVGVWAEELPALKNDEEGNSGVWRCCCCKFLFFFAAHLTRAPMNSSNNNNSNNNDRHHVYPARHYLTQATPSIMSVNIRLLFED